MIFNVLLKGCITFAKVAKMAWEGLKSAIPMLLIELLIERLVSMLVPAAAAVLAIVQGIQAAWGTVQQIIKAFQLFFTFLKAVKGGRGAAVRGGAGLGGDHRDPVRGLLPAAEADVAGEQDRGEDSGDRQEDRGGVKKIGRAVVRGVKAVGRAVKRAAKAVVRAAKRVVKAIGRGLKKVGKFIKDSKLFKAIARSKFGRAIARATRS